MSVSFSFAHSALSRSIISIHTIDPDERDAHGELSCPGCGTKMIPVMGDQRDWHFRHDEGERCAEYFAALSEMFIKEGVERAMAGGKPYNLERPPFPDVDLGKTIEILVATELEGRRVDLALVTDRGRMNIVIARRGSDKDIPFGAEGLWLVIDVTGEDERRVLALRDGIPFDKSWMTAFGFRALPPRKPPVMRWPQRREPAATTRVQEASTHISNKPAGADPDARRPGETHAEHRDRMARKYPWFSRRP